MVGNRRFWTAAVFRCVLVLGTTLFSPAANEAAAPGLMPLGEREAVTTAKLLGRVTVAGNLPQAKPLKVFKSRAYCGATVPDETLLFSADGGLRNAVVILRGIEARHRARAGKFLLDNVHCAFVPHVQVAPLNSELLLKNSDPILHTVHARLDSETLFNVGLPNWRRVTKRLDRLGVIKINCDVLHTWMTAAVVVTDSPHFAVTDERGDFAIEGLPSGDYVAEIWHERLGTQRRRLEVRAARSIHLDVVYSGEKIRSGLAHSAWRQRRAPSERRWTGNNLGGNQ